MNPYSFIVSILVYIAVIVLVFGLTYRIYKWIRIPRSNINLALYPKPKTRIGRTAKLIKDTFLFPQVYDVDRWMWLFVIALHLTIVFAFVGHMRLIREFTPLVSALGAEGMDMFALISGGIIGIIMMLAVFFLLMRRFKSPYRDISIPEDYILLLLLLIVILLGNHLRFFGDVHVTDYREYVHSLLVFKPAFTAELVASGTKWVLTTHVLFASILAIYFPFSKLMHFVGSFTANLVRSE